MTRQRKRRGILFQVRHFIVTALLGALLVIVNVLLFGCESDPKTDPDAVYYGPPPADVDGGGGGGGDVGLDAVEPPTDAAIDDVPMTYYGPPPVDATSADVPAVYYGPPPMDVVSTYYGPPPVDAVTTDTVAVYYGPMPTDVSDDTTKADVDCGAVAWYGPPPCQSDAECVEWYGAGWYCNEEYTFTDPCGQPITFPTCEQAPQP